ncbi:MAG: penicillin acylase family protein [Alphaproteobacteria bacterium]|nr:penicillin acylase family protein [Alphaproteobacteria bacterium]
MTSSHRRAGLAVLAFALSGCAALNPSPRGTEERLRAMPTVVPGLERTVTIRWNARQVPYIEAQTDPDLALALGLVHAHLRGAQLAAAKRVVQGRLSELAGSFATEVDHALRILDLGRAAKPILAAMPAESRAWLDAFVEGLNAYQRAAPAPPPEFALLGLRAEPWTAEDLIGIGRLAGADVNWFAYFAILRERGRPDFAEWWRRSRQAGANAAVSFRADSRQSLLNDLLNGFGKSGSNSVAVAPTRSASGGALLANDPHLGLSLPNLWLIAGLRSPSFQIVGLMPPGLPVVAVGCSSHFAWGGTNMRAAASDLFDVSTLPADAITERRTRIARRFWFAAERPLRQSPLGPLISDAGLLGTGAAERLALRWVGHEPSDEITAMLGAARATTPEEFRRSFASFGVSAQNILFADRAGNIGQLMAARLPGRRKLVEPDLVQRPDDPNAAWNGRLGALDLPYSLNLTEGFLASANNRPDTAVPVGFFFSDDERVRRLQQFLAARPRVTVADLIALQTDTLSQDAAQLCRALLDRLEALPGGPGEAAFIARLRGWDGDYAASANGAVAFEALLYHLTLDLFQAERPAELPAQAQQWNYLTEFLIGDIDARPAAAREALLRRAVAAAARDAARFATWGDMHRLKVAHLLSLLPVIGELFVYGDAPAGGSRETAMKTAHDLVRERHAARYGSQTRHISDMSDPDANWFVLYGGNDGWLGSANFADQILLWRAGQYVRMPLTAERVASEFPLLTRLKPARR